MRCPKCGFISFDHLETCLKCRKDISKTSENLQGTVYKVSAPAFLKFSTEPEFAEVDLPDAFDDEDDVFSDEEISDPDLDILFDDGSEDEEGDVELTMGMDESEEADVDISLDDDDDDEEGEISFNLDDFAEDVDLHGHDDMEDDKVAGKPLSIGLPDELSDMSDLEPPLLLKEVAEVAEEVEDDFDLDLDFDLNLDDEDFESVATAAKNTDLGDLSLGDLDFDDEPKVVMTKKKPATSKKDMDDDLNFELDLGDLRLDEDDKF